MGKHVDPGRKLNTSDATFAADGDRPDGEFGYPSGGSDGAVEGLCDVEAKPDPGTLRRHQPPRLRAAAVAGLGILMVIGSTAAWLGYQGYEDRQSVAKRDQFVEAARQGAINLTTIDFATIDADIQRVLDSSMGAFHDDFQQRSAPFADVVRQAKSKSVGTVTDAALLSEDGDEAEVLVNVSMTMTSANTADNSPRGWRMRIGVEQQGDTIKMSDVQFVS